MNNLIAVQIHPSTHEDPSQVASARVALVTELGGIAFEDCRLLRNEQGVISFSLPTHSIQAFGKQLPIVDVDPDLLQQIAVAAIRAHELESTDENTSIGPANAPSDTVN